MARVAFDVEDGVFTFACDATAFLGTLFFDLGLFGFAMPAAATFFFSAGPLRADLFFAAAGFGLTILAERAAFFVLDGFLTFCPNFPRNHYPVNLKR